MKKLISIVSYLPDNDDIRMERWAKLKALVDKCNDLFNLPIYILIQNYTDGEIAELSSKRNVTLSPNHPKLGITGARKALRRDCLKTGYGYFIMLDDDSDLIGTPEGGSRYLSEIDMHPSGFANFKNRQLKLFAISKDILAAVDYPDFEPADGVGFEDTVFIARCDNAFKERRFQFPDGIELADLSKGACDAMSTWYIPEKHDLREMLDKTSKMMKEHI